MRILWIALNGLLMSGLALGQSLSLGIIGGASLTEDFQKRTDGQNLAYSTPKRRIIGGLAEVRLPMNVSVEIDGGRVEDWRRCSEGAGLSVSPRFLWECLTSRTVSWFPAPATSHVACGFPALRAPAQFMSRVMRPIDWSDCRDGLSITDSVPRKKSKRAVQPLPAPPLPAEAPMLARPGQMTPNLLFYPVSDIGETPARMPDGKVFHPTTQDRINLLDHSAHRLRARGPENLPELVEQGRPFLAFGCQFQKYLRIPG